MNSSEIGALTAKYGLLDKEPFQPYVGGGLAYSVDKEFRGNPATTVKTGLAYQIGFDYALDDKSSLNLEYNQLNIQTDPQHRMNEPTPSSLNIGLKFKF